MIEPPGNDGGKEVEGIATRRQLPRHRRDEVLDGRRPLEAAQPGDPDRSGGADAAEVVPKDVDDHHVLGPILVARQQLAGQGAVFLAVAPLGRVPLIGSVVTRPARSTDRNGSGDADRMRPPIAQVEVRGVQRRIAGPQPPVERPRVAVERRFETAGEVRLVDVAAGDEPANRLDTRLVGRTVEARGERRGVVVTSSRRRGVGGRRSRSTTGRQPAVEPLRVAVDGPAADPGRAGAAVPGHDPVVEREPEQRQALVVGGDRRQPLEGVAKVVGEVADEPAEERRCVGIRWRRRGRVEAADQAARLGERVGPGRRGGEQLDRVGGEVRPARPSPGSGGLEQGETGQFAKQLGGVDRSDVGQLGQRHEPDSGVAAVPSRVTAPAPERSPEAWITAR